MLTIKNLERYFLIAKIKWDIYTWPKCVLACLYFCHQIIILFFPNKVHCWHDFPPNYNKYDDILTVLFGLQQIKKLIKKRKKMKSEKKNYLIWHENK